MAQIDLTEAYNRAAAELKADFEDTLAKNADVTYPIMVAVLASLLCDASDRIRLSLEKLGKQEAGIAITNQVKYHAERILSAMAVDRVEDGEAVQ